MAAKGPGPQRSPAILHEPQEKHALIVEISGHRDFDQYTRVKEKVAEVLGKNSRLIPHRFSRGGFAFQLYSHLAPEEVAQKLTATPLDPGFFLLKGFSNSKVSLEVH